MPPVDMSPARHAIGGFELVCSLKAENQIPVHKYRSRRTGLTVVIAEVEGPVVSGYFCVVTEAHDDDGLPHTLEHLIFLGSESYPYKGVLDLLANRCLASGTNAWTDVDHTCYTMTTAGSEGFLSLMPIYLDHILYPTLTDHGFVTEVHHVTGTGEDAGVVYCEMQGCENTGEERTHFAMMRSIYPGDCGYKANTGGVMKNLRESTTNVKVRQYHKDFYRPDNLTVIITGAVNPADVFKALAGIEDKIVSKGPLSSSKRPWQTPVPPVKESVEQRIEYPCDDEDNGIVNVAWRGPSAVTNVYEMNACALLFRYMTDTSASPLQKEFVEIEDPLASRVGCNVSENSETVIYLTFENVPTDKIELVQPRLIDILKTFADEKEKLDMKRFRTIIHKQMLERLSSLENGPHDIVALMIIGDTLYGNSVEDLNHRLNDIEDLRKMEKEPEHFWLGLLRQYFIDAPMITVKSVPSVDEQKRMTEEEQNRIKKQIEELGEEGLKRKETELKEAMESNEKPPPDEMLRSVPIPSTDSINFHTIVRYSTETEEQSPKFNFNSLPIYAYLDHINTNFVYMSIFMDTTNISSESRFYLPLLLEALLESPVKRGDKLISYEEVVSELEADTVATSTRLGVEGGGRFMCGPFSHTASILLQLEVDKYERGIEWLNELLYNTVFTADRLKIIASKISNEVAQVKRNGNKVAKDLMKDIYYDKTSNVHSSSMLRQQQFLLALIEKLNDERADSVMTDIDDVRRILTEPANMVLYMAANIDLVCKKFPDPASLWSKLLPPNNDPIKEKLKVTHDYELFAPVSIMETKPSCIVGMGCIESSFFIQTTPSIRDFNDSNLPIVLVFLQYLTQLEGPMWKQIRGAGFSYGFRICPSPNEGLLYLTFYRATNVVQAYTQAKSITETQIESAEWDSTLLESAKSSLIYEIIQREKTIGDVVEQSVLAYFKGVDKDYNRQLVASVNRVTENDLNKVGRKYIIPLFDPKSTKTTIVCSPAKAEEIADEFKEMKLHLKVYPSLEDSFLNQM